MSLIELIPERRPAAQVNFDYSTLPAELAHEAKATAERIRARNKRLIATLAEIGRDLLKMQERLEHGQFLPWIEHACGFSKSQAYRAMDVARTLGNKLPTVGNLPTRTVCLLAASSTAEHVRSEVLDRLELANVWFPGRSRALSPREEKPHGKRRALQS